MDEEDEEGRGCFSAFKGGLKGEDDDITTPLECVEWLYWT